MPQQTATFDLSGLDKKKTTATFQLPSLSTAPTPTATFDLRAPKADFDQIRAPYTAKQAFLEGLETGVLFTEPTVGFFDLDSGGQRVSRAAGNVLGMFAVHGVLNYLTGGTATVAIASGTSLQKGSAAFKAVKSAGDLWNQGKKAEAIAKIGYGNTNGFFNTRVTQSSAVNNFFKKAAQDPNAALKMLRGQRTRKEMAIFAAYGQIGTTTDQLQSDEEFDIVKNLKSLPFDVAGGALYARGAYKKAVENASLFSKKRYTVGSVESFGAGMLSTGLNSADATFGERLVSGLFVAGFNGLSGGSEYKSTINNVSRALRAHVPEIKEKKVADALAAFATRKAADEMGRIPVAFEGMDFKSKTGFTAKGLGMYQEKGKILIKYDVYAPNATEPRNKGVVSTLDKFLETYRSTPDNVVRTLQNVLPGGKGFKTFFKTDKDIIKFWEQGKWGIISADRAPFKSSLKIIPGETRDEALVRDILARGYDEKDILRIQKSGSSGYENSFVVKNLKETDAIELGKLTGQEQIYTNKGVYELVRNNKKQPLEIAEVVLHSKIAGSSLTGQTVEQGKKIIGRRKRVTGGGTILSPKGAGRGAYHRKSNTGSGVFVPASPSKFNGDVYIVELANGRKVAVGNDIAFGKVTRKTKTSKRILGETEINKLRGQTKKVTKKESHLGAHTELREVEKQRGLRDSKGGGQHRLIKEYLYNTQRTNQLTEQQANQLRGILTFQSVDGVTGVDFIDDFLKNDLKLSEFNTARLGLSIHRTYEFLYEKTGAPVFRKIAQKLLDKVADSELIKGKFYRMRHAQEKLRKGLNVSTEEFNDIMFGIIDPKRFGYKITQYSDSYLQRFEEIKTLHNQLMDEVYTLAKLANVKETVYVNGNLTRIPIRKEKNFVPLVVSDELLEVFNQNDNLYQKVFQALRIQNPGANDEELLALYKRFANNTEKNGIYGVQYSRVFTLEPVYFLDDQGKTISVRSKADYNLKVGDSIGAQRIARRIESYSTNYIDSMDRYGGRISNIITLSSHFGDGIYKYGNMRSTKGQKEYSDDIMELINEIDLQTKGRGQEVSSSQLIKLFQDDLDNLIRTEARSAGTQALADLTGYAATFGLSGFLSPIRNFMFGAIQTISTTSLTDFSRAVFNTTFNKKFRKLYSAKFSEIGGEASGMKLLDTTLQIENASQWRKLLLKGMSSTEKVNRMLAVAAGDYASARALKILRNPRASANKKSEAARLLRDTLGMGDDYVKAVERGNFTDLERNRLLVRAHGTTQGITDAAFLPRVFGKDYVKPFTLFTRIATIVTDNTYNNIVKPAREGNILPLLRYTVGAGVGGYAYANIVHTAYQTEPNQYQTMSERVWDYLDYAEFLGAFSILNDVAQSFFKDDVALADQFAVSRFAGNVAQAAVFIASGLMNIDELDDYFFNTDDIKYDFAAEKRNLYETLSQTTALTSQSYKVIKGIKQTDELKLFRELVKDQRNFQVLTGQKDLDAKYYIPSEGSGYRANLHYQYLRDAFYGGASVEEFSRAYRAAINAKAMQLQAKNRNNMTAIKAVRQAQKEVDEYIKKLDPQLLSTERNGKENSTHDLWYKGMYDNRQERLREFMNLKTWYKNRLRDVMLYSKQEFRTKDYPNYQQEMQYRGNN